MTWLILRNVYDAHAQKISPHKQVTRVGRISLTWQYRPCVNDWWISWNTNEFRIRKIFDGHPSEEATRKEQWNSWWLDDPGISLKQIRWFRWWLGTSVKVDSKWTQIAKFMGPTWGPSGSCRPQIGPMLVPWTLLLGNAISATKFFLSKCSSAKCRPLCSSLNVVLQWRQVIRALASVSARITCATNHHQWKP